MSDSSPAVVDIVIIGAGIAGLWLALRLERAGRSVALLETQAIGSGQTRTSQGIIHGGTKYALTNRITGASESISAMPARWKAALAGEGEIDLTGAGVLSPCQHLFSAEAIASRVATFFAARVMQNRARTTPRERRPAFLAHPSFRGGVYELDEVVLDVPSVVAHLAQRLRGPVLLVKREGLRFEARQDDAVKVRAEEADRRITIDAGRVVCAAGRGNEALLAGAGLDAGAAQRRPLHMVMARGAIEHPIFAHCLGAGPRPRFTITSHEWSSDSRRVWYIGGEVAESGVKRSRLEQIAAARDEVGRVLPWLNLDGLEWEAFLIDRAERAQRGGVRPDDPTILEHGPFIFAWPTKLAFAPRLADLIVERIEESGAARDANLVQVMGWPRPPLALPPWKEDREWHTFDR